MLTCPAAGGASSCRSPAARSARALQLAPRAAARGGRRRQGRGRASRRCRLRRDPGVAPRCDDRRARRLRARLDRRRRRRQAGGALRPLRRRRSRPTTATCSTSRSGGSSARARPAARSSPATARTGRPARARLWLDGASSSPTSSGRASGSRSGSRSSSAAARQAASSPSTRARPGRPSASSTSAPGSELVAANPVLAELEPDVEALIVNRLGERARSTRSCRSTSATGSSACARELGGDLGRRRRRARRRGLLRRAAGAGGVTRAARRTARAGRAPALPELEFSGARREPAPHVGGAHARLHAARGASRPAARSTRSRSRPRSTSSPRAARTTTRRARCSSTSSARRSAGPATTTSIVVGAGRRARAELHRRRRVRAAACRAPTTSRWRRRSTSTRCRTARSRSASTSPARIFYRGDDGRLQIVLVPWSCSAALRAAGRDVAADDRRALPGRAAGSGCTTTRSAACGGERPSAASPTFDAAVAELLEEAEPMSGALDELVSSLLYEGYALYPYTPGATKNATPTPFGIVYPPATPGSGATSTTSSSSASSSGGDPRVDVEAVVFLQATGERPPGGRAADRPRRARASRRSSTTASGRGRVEAVEPGAPRARCASRTSRRARRALPAPRRSSARCSRRTPLLRAPRRPLRLPARGRRAARTSTPGRCWRPRPTTRSSAPRSSSRTTRSSRRRAAASLFDGDRDRGGAAAARARALATPSARRSRRQDPAVREMVERAPRSTPEDIMRLHGHAAARRRPSSAPTRDAASSEAVVDGVTFRPGDRLVLRLAGADRPLRPHARRPHRDARADLRRLRRHASISASPSTATRCRSSCARPAATSSSSRTRWRSSPPATEAGGRHERMSEGAQGREKDNPAPEPATRASKGLGTETGAERGRRPGRRDQPCPERARRGAVSGHWRTRTRSGRPARRRRGEVEEDADTSARTSSNELAMSAARRAVQAKKQILVAAVGNIWLRDDGFGGEVAKRLQERELPTGVQVVDFGTGGLDLAYEVMRGYDALVLVDVSRQGGEPGTLYVMEADAGVGRGRHRGRRRRSNPHAMDPQTVLRFVKSVGGWPGKVIVVACEPAEVEEMGIGLTEAVEAVVDRAVALVAETVDELRALMHELVARQRDRRDRRAPRRRAARSRRSTSASAACGRWCRSRSSSASASSRASPSARARGSMLEVVPAELRCADCGHEWELAGAAVPLPGLRRRRRRGRCAARSSWSSRSRSRRSACIART